MNYRKLGKTNFKISEVSLGTWQLGGKWGSPFDEKTAEATLNKAIDLGINFFDTADAYNKGKSEIAIGKVLKKRSEKVYVATKLGRFLNPFNAEGFNEDNIRRFVDDSRKRMDVDKLDLVQLHNPPTEIYYDPEIFEILDKLKDEGKILNYGVSVFTVEEALKAIEYPDLATVQIIFNIFRQRPRDLFFPRAKEKNIGIIIRGPLASGLLTGKFNKDSTFDKGDHRAKVAGGDWKKSSESFSGVPYDKGLEAVEELKRVFPPDELPKYALKWILMNENVSCVIPGASRTEQLLSNISASDLKPLSEVVMEKVNSIYEKYIKEYIHQRW